MSRLAAALLGLVLGGGVARAQDLVYPLDHPPLVTSTYGTYRLSHHHAGLDLVTGGDETVAVLASEDGEVYRMQRSHVGYGRALYVRHAGGRHTVYGHLSAFAPKIAAVERAIEAKQRSYGFKKRPKAIPVRRGEAIGYVGTGGTDLVHLHYEVRLDGQPVDPFTNGLKVKDEQPPAIARLLLVPLDAAARIDGATEARFVELVPPPEAPVTIRGRVGLFVEVRETMPGHPRDLVAREVAFSVDGQLRHRTRYDLISYADKGKAYPELDFDPALRAANAGMFQRMWQEGPRVPFHRKAGRPLSDLRPGTHRAEITAVDSAGNASARGFTLQVEAGDAPGPCAPKRATLPTRGANVRREAPGPRYARRSVVVVPVPELCAAAKPELMVRINDRAVDRPVVTRLRGAPAVALDLPEKKDAEVVIAWRAPDGGVVVHALRFWALQPRARIDMGPLRLDLPRDGWLLSGHTELEELPNPAGPGLEPVSPLYAPTNAWLPSVAGTRVSLALPAGIDRRDLGFYQHDAGRWWYLSRTEVQGRILAGTIHPTGFAFMRDRSAPVIGDAVFEPHPAGPRLVVSCADTGSGAKRPTLRFDGVEVPYEWQNAWQRAIWLPMKPPKPGEHTVEVEVEDRAGHTSRRTQKVAYPPRVATPLPTEVAWPPPTRPTMPRPAGP